MKALGVLVWNLGPESTTTRVLLMPERSEGIPFFFLALDMGVARFQFSLRKLSEILMDLDENLAK